MTALRQQIDRHIRRGYRVVSETRDSAQLVKPKKISIGWLIVSICTLVGWIPYLGYHLLLKRESSVYLAVADDGKVKASSHRR